MTAPTFPQTPIPTVIELPPMLRRCVVPGLAYSVERLADRRTVAVALLGLDGWKVAAGGRVVAVRLDQAQAVRLMMRVALAAAYRASLPVHVA